MMKIRAFLLIPVVLLAVSVSYSQSSDSGTTQEQFDTSGDKVIDFFEVHSADMKSVLRQLSAYSGVDIVAAEDVEATVSMSVTNKSWREILSILCRMHDLSAVEEANYVYVVSGGGGFRSVGDTGEAGPAAGVSSGGSSLAREIIKLQFTTADEIKGAVEGLLSSKGKLTVVKHTNALIVFDKQENISQIRETIEQIDVQTSQISISCKIIEVSSGVLQKMGTHWGFMDQEANVTADQLSENDILGDAINRVTYGVLSPEKLSVAMEYLFEDNKAEVVAQPQITTLDNKEANIFMGQQIPINTKDEAGNVVTQMVNAGTELTVTPYLSGEGKIKLTLNPKKESYTLSQGTPIINEQSATTNVMVNNGETVVIAGLTSNEERTTEGGIPILKDIPLIGNLFKRSQKTLDKSDLIIFVTPHIIHSEM
ncbi:MAG: secretin N-terminal domain-containing protein [Chitinispirillaceae bacterium]